MGLCPARVADVGGFYPNAMAMPTPGKLSFLLILKTGDGESAEIVMFASNSRLHGGRIDPADIAVRSAVDDIHPAARAVLKHKAGSSGKVKFHDRFAD